MLPSLRRETEVGGDIARAAEARRILDRSAEAEGGDRADAGDHHEAAAQLIAHRDLHHQFVEHEILGPQSSPRLQHRLHQPERHRVVVDCLENCLCEAAATDLPKPDAERFERVANGVFEVQELAFQIAPLRQQQPHPVAALRLDMRLAEPAGAHQMGNTKRIRRASLVALGAHRSADVPRLQAHSRNAERHQFGMQPWRQ